MGPDDTPPGTHSSTLHGVCDGPRTRNGEEGLQVMKQTAFGSLVLWPEGASNRRRAVRVPTGTMVAAESMQGQIALCMVRDVGEGGVCVEWHAAPVDLDDQVKLVFERRNRDTVETVELLGVVRWYSPKYVGLAFTDSPTKDESR